MGILNFVIPPKLVVKFCRVKFSFYVIPSQLGVGLHATKDKFVPSQSYRDIMVHNLSPHEGLETEPEIECDDDVEQCAAGRQCLEFT